MFNPANPQKTAMPEVAEVLAELTSATSAKMAFTEVKTGKKWQYSAIAGTNLRRCGTNFRKPQKTALFRRNCFPPQTPRRAWRVRLGAHTPARVARPVPVRGN